jgi:hypothetical protein
MIQGSPGQVGKSSGPGKVGRPSRWSLPRVQSQVDNKHPFEGDRMLLLRRNRAASRSGGSHDTLLQPPGRLDRFRLQGQ